MFELLTENGLSDYYRLADAAGIRGGGTSQLDQFGFVDEPAVRQRLVDFSDARLTRVSFHLPSIHCLACVWLLENLFRLQPGISHSQVNFPRKEVAISFETGRVKLSRVVALLTSLGYEPDLRLSALEIRPKGRRSRKLWLQLGVAGFAFGNTMLFSVASYLGLDSASGPAFRQMVGWISLALAIPVVVYSASDYWRSAWLSLRQRMLNIEVPIAAGILAFFAQSSYEVLTGRGEGYFDSLSGLLFFLLCGKLFQQKTFDRLAFDRDYRSFFPLSVRRLSGRGEEAVSISQLAVGDRLIVRNGELIPADSRLVEGAALIDYSFVTGESEPVRKAAHDHLYAGGRQIGEAIQVQTVKEVSQGYLTSLWNQEAFQKRDPGETLQTLIDQYSQRFTIIVIGIAVGAAAFWACANPALSIKAFTSVLIVACPCALALAAPYTLGTALRVLARRNVFIKNPTVLEQLAASDAIVFDKTGTLTAGMGSVEFRGTALNELEKQWLVSLARHSTHPHAVRIRAELSQGEVCHPVQEFQETPGCGMEGRVAGHSICMGSAAWLQSRTDVPARLSASSPESQVHLAIDGTYRGCFAIRSRLRPETEKLLAKLSTEYELSLLSGDNGRDRERWTGLFGPTARLHFDQSPMDKLKFVQGLQDSGRRVVMVGDGLNDAGALKQSDVGVAVVENVSAFSPASDVIMGAEMVPHLSRVNSFARSAVRVVRAGFWISTIYNVVGISIAARGWLAPVVCAILMPLSSVTVMVFACGVTGWLGRRILPATREIPASTITNRPESTRQP